MDTQTLVRLLDLTGIAVFALSGALMAVRLRQTLVTASFFALVTGVGGGSVRDLLIGAPVFWVQDGAIGAVCIAIALVVWVLVENRRFEGPPTGDRIAARKAAIAAAEAAVGEKG